MEARAKAIKDPMRGGRAFFLKVWPNGFFLKVWPNLRLSLSCSKLLGKDYSQGLLLQQAIGEGPSAGSSFAASYWGRTIRRVFFCSKLLGKDHSQGLLLQKAITAGSSFAARSWRNSIRQAFFQQTIGQNSCVIPFIIYILYNIEYRVYNNILHTIYNI